MHYGISSLWVNEQYTDAFRYCMEGALGGAMRYAVQEARSKEIKEELLD